MKCEYIQQRIGEEFVGTVATVTGFGLFVELDDIYIEGLVLYGNPGNLLLAGADENAPVLEGGTIGGTGVTISAQKESLELTNLFLEL